MNVPRIRVLSESPNDVVRVDVNIGQMGPPGPPAPAPKTPADAAAMSFAADRVAVETQTFLPLPASGGANYTRVPKATLDAIANLPVEAWFRSQDRFMPDGTVDATNGGYWLLDPMRLVNIRQVGTAANWTTAASKARLTSPKAPFVIERGVEYGINNNAINSPYGLSHKSALGLHMQMGSGASPVKFQEPLILVEKVIASDRSVDPNLHDEGAATFSTRKMSGDSNAYASTHYIVVENGAEGDSIGVHGRVRLNANGLNTHGFGGWFYVHVAPTFQPKGAYGIEIDGQNSSGFAPIYRDPDKRYEILRLVVTGDNGDKNIFTTHVAIGGTATMTGENGSHIGIHFQRGAVRSFVGEPNIDGENIRIDGPMAAGRSFGGIRFSKGYAEDLGHFRYFLRTDEALVGPDKAAGLFGDGHAFYWGDHTLGLVGEKPRLTGTGDHILVSNNTAEINTLSPVLHVQHMTTGLAAAGIGAGIGFATEMTNGGSVVGMVLGARATDMSVGTQDFDLVVELVENGVRAERFTVNSGGRPTWTMIETGAPTLAANNQMSLVKMGDTKLRAYLRGGDGVTRYSTLNLSTTGFGIAEVSYLEMTDGVTAPTAAVGRARLFVDGADGDLKVVFGDGVVKTVITD